MQRIFYIILFEDPKVQAHLDSIKYFSDYRQKTCAHITVKGPFRSRISVENANRILRGGSISVMGPGFFFGEAQNTVFLQAGYENLRSVWNKRDFGYKPHITLYDGGSRVFAGRLLELLRQKRLFFECGITELQELISYKGQYNFGLYLDQHMRYVSHIFDFDVLRAVPGMGMDERLGYISLLCRSLRRSTGIGVQAGT